MRTAHLFAGAGGGLLADLILGHEPVLAVERPSSAANRNLTIIADLFWSAGATLLCSAVFFSLSKNQIFILAAQPSVLRL